MAYEDLMRMLLAQNPELNIPGGGFMAVPDEESANIAKRNSVGYSNTLDRILAGQDRRQAVDNAQRMAEEERLRSNALTRAVQDNPALMAKTSNINPQAATMLAAMSPRPEPERVPINIPSGTDMSKPEGAMAFMKAMLESGDITPAQYLQGANQARDDMKPQPPQIKTIHGKAGTKQDFEFNPQTGKYDIPVGEQYSDMLTSGEMNNLVHPKTLAPAPMGLTREDAIKEGYIKVSADARDKFFALENTRSILDETKQLADKLIKAKDAMGAAKQGARLEAGAFTKLNKDASVYDDGKQAFIGVISRTMGGERGVLTDRDIARINNLYPKFRDTKEIKDGKMDMIYRVYETAVSAAKKRILGMDIAEEKALIGKELHGEATEKETQEWEEGGVKYRINPATGKKQIWRE